MRWFHLSCALFVVAAPASAQTQQQVATVQTAELAVVRDTSEHMDPARQIVPPGTVDVEPDASNAAATHAPRSLQKLGDR